MSTIEAIPEWRSEAQILLDNGLLDELVASCDEAEARALLWDWSFWGRPSQHRPVDGRGRLARQWFIRKGRGGGKTRTGAEEVRRVTSIDKSHGRLALVAPTAGDARDVIVEGESGILATSPPEHRPHYEPSKRRLTWPSGAIATVYSGEKPDRLRGPQHDYVWIDEPASMPLGEDALNNARLGLRLGSPLLLVTGTPKPKRWLRDLAEEAATVVSTGSTYENIANLAPEFVELILGRFDGTRLGRQEIYGEFLDDVEGALWTAEIIEAGRMAAFDLESRWKSLRTWLWQQARPASLTKAQNRPWRTIVAVDPPGETAECGIITATAPKNGVAGRDHAVVLADASLPGRPERWGRAAVAEYHRAGAEAIYVESNQGGDMVRSTIHAVDPDVPVRKIRAKESKKSRAEPIAALYERGFVHHLGFFPMLEEQLTTWIPPEQGGDSKSPDRLDAAVHAIRELLQTTVVAPARGRSARDRNI